MSVRIVTRLGRGRWPLSPFLTGSLLVHVVLVSAALLFPSFRKQPHFPEDAVIVELVAPPAPGPVAQAAPPPNPEPKPQPQPEAVVAEPEPPKPAPRDVKPAPRKKSPPKTEPKPQPTPPAPPPRTETSHEAVAAAGSGADSLAGMGAEFSWYRDAVVRALYGQWRQPILDGIREPVEVAVSFEILRDGSVRSLRIDTTSGIPSLDRSALRAVQEAPLPPLPPQFRGATQPAQFVFRLFPEGR